MNTPRGERPSMTDCGLPGIKSIPFGVHMCNFYRTGEELAAALVPYFTAGMRNNERCVWITAEPLDAAAACAALHAADFDVDTAVLRGALVIRDYSDWYAEAGKLKGADVVGLWLDEEKRALAAGYSGLRITGNVTFLRPQDWELFMEYEVLVNRAFSSQRIVTLCTYHLERCGASEVLDVMRSHHCTLDHPDKGWQILTSQAR
jgi:hypothetical protein